MKSLTELVREPESTMTLINSWVYDGNNVNQGIILPCNSKQGEEELVRLQISTHSTLGAIAYCTGGILFQNGWLRVIGSGHNQLPRTISSWNKQCDSFGYLLIGDDAAGGFFALNSGSLGEAIGKVYYFAPDTLEWEQLNMGYTDFLHWAFTGNLEKYYEGLRWNTWTEDLKKINSEQGMTFFPPLWTKQGNLELSNKSIVPIHEIWGINKQFKEQLGELPDGAKINFKIKD